MSSESTLCSDPLSHAVFKKFKAIGHQRMDGQSILVEGARYDLTAHLVCNLRLVHVVAEKAQGPGAGHQRAMVFLEVNKNGYPGMDGAAHLMPALLNGIRIDDPRRPAHFFWHILRAVEVPRCFISSDDTSDADANANEAAYNRKSKPEDENHDNP